MVMKSRVKQREQTLRLVTFSKNILVPGRNAGVSGVILDHVTRVTIGYFRDVECGGLM